MIVSAAMPHQSTSRLINLLYRSCTLAFLLALPALLKPFAQNYINLRLYIFYLNPPLSLKLLPLHILLSPLRCSRNSLLLSRQLPLNFISCFRLAFPTHVFTTYLTVKQTSTGCSTSCG